MPNTFRFRFIAGCAFFAAAIGMGVLVGWQFDLPYLKSPVPRLVAMNPVTAVNFILAGIWIALYSDKRSRARWKKNLLYFLPLFIITTGVLKWVDIVFGYSIRVDQALFAGRIEDSQLAPTTALNLILISIGMYCLLRPRAISQKLFNGAMVLALFISLFSVSGYVAGDITIYTRKPFVPMALHSAITFVFCILSLFLSYPKNIIVENFSSKNFGGVMARRLIPYVLSLRLVLEFLRMVGERNDLFDSGFGVALQATAMGFIFLFLIWRSAYFLNIADIKRKQNEADLEKAKREAEEASLSKTRFLSSMSHEIRTPLNGILGFADILSKSEVSKKEQQEFLGHIKTSGELLLKLIGDILDVNKIEAGKLELENESFPFKEYVSSAIYPYKHTINEKGLDFRLKIDDSIPAYIVGDRHRINQMLVNLLGNSIKFTSRGYIGIQIDKLSETEKQVELRISVFDTGIGIDRDKTEKVFESFTQASDSVARHYGGSGLGLTIVKELLRLMNGTIRVSSPSPFGSVADFKGTCVEMVIPFLVDRSEHLPKEPIPTPAIKGAGSPLYILVAEDNLLNQKIASYMLTKLGHRFDLAENGNEALEMVQHTKYDLVFMDIHMPVMNGFQSAQLIRKLNLTVPIIGLTANVFKDDVQQCLDSGMNDHLGKPYNEEQLNSMIGKWCRTEQAAAVH
jgi:signal transduction histidine kinase/ActR/RegA family two-component response regulator